MRVMAHFGSHRTTARGGFLFGGFMTISDVWVLEYSTIQGCYHIDTLEKATNYNFMQAVGKRPFAGYMPIFAGTMEQCYAISAKLKDSGLKMVGRDDG